MAPPRTYRCEALTLRSSPLGEADLIVTLYTREHGKLRAVAKGARKSASKLVGHLEPLTQVRLSLSRGRSLDIVAQAQVLQSFPDLKSGLTGIAQGLYVAELLDGFGSEASPNPELYQLALDLLAALGPDSDERTGDGLPLRYFELHLLRHSGLLPELYHCVECRREIAPDEHRYSPNMGGVLCLSCNPDGAHVRPLSLRALKVLRLMHRGSVGKVASLAVNPSLSAELQGVLSNTVRYWLGKEIRSNSFLEHLHNYGKTGVYS